MLKTRLLKAHCPDCGYIVRVTRRWIAEGYPICPCGSEMEAAEPMPMIEAQPWRRVPDQYATWRTDAVLYFAQEGDDGPVKIGYSANARKRVPMLQVGNARRLRFLASMPAEPGTERAWHDRFESARIRGEWFEPVPELLAAIDDVRAAHAA